MDTFCLNKIPLLITLSRKIDLTAKSHFPTQKSRDIFKIFLCIYVFSLTHGFIIMTVHADGESAPVSERIEEMTS